MNNNNEEQRQIDSINSMISFHKRDIQFWKDMVDMWSDPQALHQNPDLLKDPKRSLKTFDFKDDYVSRKKMTAENLYQEAVQALAEEEAKLQILKDKIVL